MNNPIAIVGMACIYPEARSPRDLWENALAQRRAFRRIPDQRIRLEDYHASNRAAEDKTYATEAAVIQGYEFDRVRFRVVGSTYRQADLAHWLALDVASRTLADAGYLDGEGLPRENTGVILGNTLTGEFSRANVMRLRWPYVRRTFQAVLDSHQYSEDQQKELLSDMERAYKKPFPAVGEETLAGGLSNTIAGRICNQYDLKGGGYTLDGACASSLLAVANACSSLVSGDLDLALAGGVDLSLDPFELIGFAKVGALAPELMRVYDAHSAGFWPGEGCGFVALMRHEDALAQGKRIYGLIQGWGVSSDGSGGITRPEIDGQLRALRRAYRRAGFGPDTITLFEGHGTGTQVGDATELKVLSQARKEANPAAEPAFLGSIKANIGHTKAAAGVAGLIKATMALHSQVLPPTTGCITPHPIFKEPSPALQTLSEPRVWPETRPLRAAVSAMGFGGINAHVVLEEASSTRRRRLSSSEKKLGQTAQDTELFVWSASERHSLRERLEHLLGFAARLSRSELSDLAGTLAAVQDSSQSPYRAALLAASPSELAEKIQVLLDWLAENTTRKEDVHRGIFLGKPNHKPNIGFLFPGQASPPHFDGGIFKHRFAQARDLYPKDHPIIDSGTVATQWVQPAIARASLMGLRILNDWGLQAKTAIGHSLGEITALHWAGAFSEVALLRIASVRGEAMGSLEKCSGAMAAISAPWQEVETMLNGNGAVIAGYNSPKQTVLSGETQAINAVLAKAQARGFQTVRLPVSHAFHTPLVQGAVPKLKQQLLQENLQPPARTIQSTISGSALNAHDDLADLLCQQVTCPVRFIEAVQSALETPQDAPIDLWIEVGPGQVLSGLFKDCLETSIEPSDTLPSLVLPIDSGGPSLKGILTVAAAAFTLGALPRPSLLFQDRHLRPFDLDWNPSFFSSPCEDAPQTASLEEQDPSIASTASPGPESDSASTMGVPDGAATLDLIRQKVAERTELPLESIQNTNRMLSDLHLNSISVGQIVGEVARQLALPPMAGLNEYANASLQDIAAALDDIKTTGTTTPETHTPAVPPGVAAWIEAFEVRWTPQPLPQRADVSRSTQTSQPAQASSWKCLAPPDHPLFDLVQSTLAQCPHQGVAVLMPPRAEAPPVDQLLEAARELNGLSGEKYFLLIQQGALAGAFARTLHQETSGLTTCVLHLPWQKHSDMPAWIISELNAASGYGEALYDETGTRHEPIWQLSSEATAKKNGAVTSQGPAVDLGPKDVLLVTGGGKGIAAECALELGRQTGVNLILMGRSRPDSDPELEANLNRFREAGLTFHYAAADVANHQTVTQALATAVKSLGPVTALIHGAGINHPKLVSALDRDAFDQTWKPKIEGLNNILANVDPNRLKLLVTFGSIIARMGLAGEADYALTNEWLTQLTETFQRDHPHCHCLALEWSVWSGVGMGQRLGRVDALLQQGITPIPPEEGIAWLNKLIRQKPRTTAQILTGRFGLPPTANLNSPSLPLLRFLEDPKVHYPGLELVVEAVLSPESDPYVKDHLYHGERLFPAVMGLEAMAQTAMALTGSSEPPNFENVTLERPVVVPGQGKTRIRLAALKRSAHAVDVVLRCEDSGFQINHFSATCRFGQSRELMPHIDTDTTADGHPYINTLPLSLDPITDLYEPLLFHTGRFRRVQAYRKLSARECVVELAADAAQQWFGHYLSETRVLGDTGVRDAAIHAIQACIPHAQLLPIGIGRIRIGPLPCLQYQAPEASNGHGSRLFLHARERFRDGDEFHYDLELKDEKGLVLEQWEDLRLRKVESLKHDQAWKTALLIPYLERRMEELFPGRLMDFQLDLTGPTRKPGSSRALLRKSATGKEVIHHRPDGRPESRNGSAVSVSAAHADDLSLAATLRSAKKLSPKNNRSNGNGTHRHSASASDQSPPFGCDMEFVIPRSQQTWTDLLTRDRLTLARLLARETPGCFDESATRTWSAMECLKKAGLPPDAPMVFTGQTEDGWVQLRSGLHWIVSRTFKVEGHREPLVISILSQPAQDQIDPIPARPQSTASPQTDHA